MILRIWQTFFYPTFSSQLYHFSFILVLLYSLKPIIVPNKTWFGLNNLFIRLQYLLFCYVLLCVSLYPGTIAYTLFSMYNKREPLSLSMLSSMIFFLVLILSDLYCISVSQLRIWIIYLSISTYFLYDISHISMIWYLWYFSRELFGFFPFISSKINRKK